MAQIHKWFSDVQIKDLIERYMTKELERVHIHKIQEIGKTPFFALVKKYRANPQSFSVQYPQKQPARKISKEIENTIIKELQIEKTLIENPLVPLRFYNYSYIKLPCSQS